MNAQYHSVEIVSEGLARRLRFVMENAAAEPWPAEPPVVASYQIYDPSTGALLVDGERVPLPASLPPGASISLEMPLQLPEEAGNYRIYASPMVEHQAWAWEAGSPFVLVDLTITSKGDLRVDQLRVTNHRELRRRSLFRTVIRAFTFPFRTVWRNRHLSYVLVKREILSRSRGSFFGALWTILNPLLLMLTYFFVFGLVLKSRFGNDPSPAGFALYFLAGMLPWLAFSESIGRAPTVLIEYRQMIKKIVFPIEMLPVNIAMAGLVGEAFGLIVFCVAFLLIRHRIPWTVIFLPALLVPQIVFTVALCWFLSALGAFLRDLAQVNGFVLTLWFFVTPICYPETQIPAGARGLLSLNPIFILVRGYRAIFLEARAPDWPALLTLTAISFLLAVLGHAWFYKLKRSFADVL